jgi:lipid-binding SYLF domain-containing protein
VGVGAGYGVAVDKRTDERTYLRMSRFDLGMGWGARALRPVMIFHDEEKFRRFIDGNFDVTLGAEASAKVGEAGAAGGGSGESARKDLGYSSYVITDAGVSATASLAMIRVKRVKLKD